MTIFKKTFGGSTIEFEPFIANNNVMVNATEMAKIFNKQVVAFLRNEDTKNFISECLKSENSHFLGIKNESDLIISKQRSGTWMHRVLALKFAAWLNPAFELWVYQVIEEIMFGYSREQDQSIQRTVLIQHEMKQIEKKPDRTGEDFDRYMKMQAQLTYERTLRSQVTKQRFREFYKFFVSNLRIN
jgi:hypothetical protein